MNKCDNIKNFSRRLVCGVLACVISFGMVAPVMASGGITGTNNQNVTGKEVYDYLQQLNLLLAGASTSVPAANRKGFAIGQGAYVDIANAPDVSNGSSFAIGKNSYIKGDNGGKDSFAVGLGSYVDGKNSGNNCFAIGIGSHVSSTGENGAVNSFAVGHEASVTGNGGGSYSFAIGYRANVKSVNNDANYAMAIGQSAKIEGTTASMAVGYGAAVTGNNNGNSSIAVGNIAKVKNANNSIAIGRNANVVMPDTNSNFDSNSIAIGYNAYVNNSVNSVAIGSESTVSETDNVVSFGHGVGDPNSEGGTYTTEINRRLIHVAKGINGTDGVNVSQLNEAIANIGSGGSSGGTSGVEYTAGKGITITKHNLNVLEALQAGIAVDDLTNYGVPSYAIEFVRTNWNNGNYNADWDQWGNMTTAGNSEIATKNVIMYDTDANDIATLAGSRGTILTNLKAGELSKTSTDAVIGNQLWTTNQNLAGMRTDISTNANNIASLNESVTNALESVSSIGTLVNTVNDLKADKSLNNLDNAGKQVISAAAANAVQEYMANNKIIMNAIVPDDNSPATGGEVYTAIENAKNELQGNIDTKADISYVDERLGEKADIADVYMKSEMDTLLNAKVDADIVYTKDETDALLSDKADVSYVDEELSKKADIKYVDDALQAKADKADLDVKANVDASNIDVESWAGKLGTGKVLEGNTGLVTGGTVYSALKNMSGNDLIKAGNGMIEIGSDVKYDGLDSVSVAKSDGSPRVLRGVTVDIKDGSSAANVGYVNSVAGSVMNGINNSIASLDRRINKTGAGAAALANLHPVQNDGDIRWSIAAGLGRYHGESAGAVGVFYQPSDSVSVNLSSTVGNGDTMFGVGVSLAIDKPMVNGTSKVMLANEIQQLKVECENDTNEIKLMKKEHEQDNYRISQLEMAVSELIKTKK